MAKQWDKSKAPQANACKPVEWLLAFASIRYGFVLLLPDDTYGTTPSFGVLARLGWFPEWLLGTLIMTIGVVQLTAVIKLGHRVRRAVAVVACFEWLMLYSMVASYAREQHIRTPTTTMYELAMWGAAYCLIYIANTVRRRLDDRSRALGGKS